MDQNVKQQIIERLNSATNVLVTVSANPSVDQLAACIGLTLILNKQGKHATAVFSGEVPSTIEFLQPEATLEKDTNSLRDFIIALDKSKADKLRYKVEDKLVRIFITPYKTSITDKDLEFSQGDFNVDAVVALGVQVKEDLDKAITSHGRILHDATVISINRNQASNLGTLNWQDAQSSSLCEMVVDLGETLQPDSFDAQMATALLTGIVAETERFSNVKTSPRTMSLSAKLMAAGANQQLVAAKLQTNLRLDQVAQPAAKDKVDKTGTLEIEHSEPEPKTVPTLEADVAKNQDKATVPSVDGADKSKGAETGLPPVAPEASEPQISHIKSADLSAQPPTFNQPETNAPSSRIATQPPSMGGTLTANSKQESFEPGQSTAADSDSPILSHGAATLAQTPDPVTDSAHLDEIEKAVGSPHVQQEDMTEARSAVEAALDTAPDDAIQAALTSIGAQPLDLNVNSKPEPVAPTEPNTTTPVIDIPDPQVVPQEQPLTELPNSLIPPDPGLPPEQTAGSANPAPPPPVPPPMMPPTS